LRQITLKNEQIELTVIDYGAIIQKLIVRDKDGKPINVVVGFENPEDYKDNPMFLGACIGRYAGRITNGAFKLNEVKYTMHSENGVHLHGGKVGFDKKIFVIDDMNHGEEPFVKLSYLSPDLEEGYPGNLKVTVTYKLVANELHIIHEAITDKTTVVNLTNHSYFKLDEESTVNQYKLQLDSSHSIETDSKLLPTGNLIPVQNTEYDFLVAKKINGIQLDTPFALNPAKGFAGSVYSEISGIKMQVKTNQPCMVIYTPPSTGSICFETQNYPDAPNHANFPSSILQLGEAYKNESIFSFDVK
jgi:aldose 1-epimerase